MQTSKKTNLVVKLGMLAALGVVLMLVTRIPLFADFLKYEAGDVPALVASFVFGPIYGLCVITVTSIIQFIAVDQASGPLGLFAHVVASGTFVVVAGLIYKKFHSMGGAVAALLAGSLSMVVVMFFLNLYVLLPIWMPGTDSSIRWSFLITAILPFNIVKTLVNSVLTFAVYKAASGYLAKESLSFRNSKTSD